MIYFSELECFLLTNLYEHAFLMDVKISYIGYRVPVLTVIKRVFYTPFMTYIVTYKFLLDKVYVSTVTHIFTITNVAQLLLFLNDITILCLPFLLTFVWYI